MQLIILIVYTVLFSATVVSPLPVGWLLMLSLALILYCGLSYLISAKEFTSFYQWIVALSFLGLLYSVLVLCHINMTLLF